MNAQKFHDDLAAAVRLYTEQRGRSPRVRVTLPDGTKRYVMSEHVGPGDRMITLDLYPEVAGKDVVANLVAVERGGDDGEVHFTRDVVLVEPGKILKVELIYEDEPARPRLFGFHLPEQE